MTNTFQKQLRTNYLESLSNPSIMLTLEIPVKKVNVINLPCSFSLIYQHTMVKTQRNSSKALST